MTDNSTLELASGTRIRIRASTFLHKCYPNLPGRCGTVLRKASTLVDGWIVDVPGFAYVELTLDELEIVLDDLIAETEAMP